jgi:glycosyltransferase involved in cell wall biosynthesis
VFFTWHAGADAVQDPGFGRPVAWDIPMTDGYDFELLPNSASDPGTHRFFGVRNPRIVERIAAWNPDAAHVTGFALASHLQAIVALPRRGVPVLFRGDSHLLEQRAQPAWRVKRAARRLIFRRPSVFLHVGTHNRAYYRDAGVPETKLVFCPHSIDVRRFAEPNEVYEQQAAEWRREVGITSDKKVLLFAGKFERKKRPLELIDAFMSATAPDVVLLLVGDGELADAVRARMRAADGRISVLPFQNQSRMPVVLRMGDVVCLPSAYGETWGLAVNEALACGRPALVSSRVGCAPDLIRPGINGDVFAWDDWGDFEQKLRSTLRISSEAERTAIRCDAARFSTTAAAEALAGALHLATCREE